MEPLIALTLDRPDRCYECGETLRVEYQIDAVQPLQIHATEASVLWCTEGKGEPDMGVHFFRRTTRDEHLDRDLRPMRRIEVDLPFSPLSYEGVILKIRWCVRIRLFLTGGKDFLEELSFTLGKLPPAVPVVEPAESAGEDLPDDEDALAEDSRQEQAEAAATRR